MQLNLARKWRSQIFDTIIGQQLPIRMLKNSLYAQHYFPVYLFAGVRGCGKTTTARVFAAALNCQNLERFIQDPKNQTIPCLSCTSCRSMQEGKHPDFIEIDAASHTGVDNVRAIIEAASFMPLVGRKKVYLIDEAHMLSKAAFNALLKILEEPPPSVLFMLATTETHKIIETVRSRCFQLFFAPVPSPELASHLAYICEQENITYERSALDLIAHETQGSVRDALNIIEQVRFSAAGVTYQAVLAVLGHIDDETLFALITLMVNGDQPALIKKLSEGDIASFSQTMIWAKLIDIFRAILWIQQGVKPSAYHAHYDRLKELASLCSLARTIAILELLYKYEQLFIKTTAQVPLLELIVLKLTQTHAILEKSVETRKKASDESAQVPIPKPNKPALNHDWALFLQEIETLKDPLISSIFKQADFIAFDTATQVVNVSFAQQLIFFNDWLQKTQKLWRPLLTQCFGQEAQLSYHFNSVAAKPVEVVIPAAVPPKQTQPSPETVTPYDVRQGKNAQMVTRVFPGTLSLIKDT